MRSRTGSKTAPDDWRALGVGGGTTDHVPSDGEALSAKSCPMGIEIYASVRKSASNGRRSAGRAP